MRGQLWTVDTETKLTFLWNVSDELEFLARTNPPHL